MIDLHCHILPGIDDGAKDLATSLEMAKIAFESGTRYLACTPHIMAGIYPNYGSDIRQRVALLQENLDKAGIGLGLIQGADIHVTLDLIEGLRAGTYPTLNGSRYFLLEPPHHVMPPRLVEFCIRIMQDGYIPVLTHPERLTWIEQHYDAVKKLDDAGVLIQLTAASISGRFGPRALYWSERMLEEGRVDLIASDGHNTRSRPPRMDKARERIAELYDDELAIRLTLDTPLMVVENRVASNISES